MSGFTFVGLCSAEAGNLGSFLSGIATCLAVGVAWLQIKGWKQQQVVTRRAEVAGRALTAVLRLGQALQLLTSLRVDSPTDPVEEAGPQKKTYQLRRDQAARIRATEPDLNNYFAAMNEAEVYLPDEVNLKLETLWKLWVSTKVDISMHALVLDSGGAKSAEDKRYFDESFGEAGRLKRESVISEIKKSLKPIAQMTKT